MKFETMTVPEAVQDDYLVATYYMKSDTEPDLYDWVKLVAADQSAGTWTHIEGETPEMIEKYGAKVIGIYPMAGERAVVARIAFPTANFPAYTPMIMSTVAGNVLGQDGIRLVDIDFPKSFLDELPGPIFGMDGLRAMLGVKDRPLLGAILKPCVGVAPDASAKGAVDAAEGGAEVIKDDELMSYPDYSPMLDRLKAVMAGLKAVGREKSTLYAVNITGPNLIDRASRAIEAGANSIMVNFQAVGWAASEDLVRYLREQNVKVPIFGHSAGMGAYYRAPGAGISTALCCGKLARIIGMDMPLVYPDSGRFGISTNEMVETHRACIGKMGPIKPACMTLAGGVRAGTIDYLMGILGNDDMLMAGGGIYGHPDGATAGAKSILQAMEAVQKGVSAWDAAEDNKELARSLEFWDKK
mgnify:CR=1 FL=1|jgi:Ribulose 1,5-bisphosphate carboxylase, large subunit